jgi:MFS family permease
MKNSHPAHIFVLYITFLNLGMSFICTGYVPWLLHIGLTMGEVALVNAAFFGVISLAELPTGLLADGRSRAWSIRIGLLIMIVAQISYAYARGFWSAVVSESLCGLAFAFMSGADEAWLTDALKARGEQDSLGRVLGTSALWSSLAMVVGGFSGAYLNAISPRWPWLFGAGAQFAAFVTCALFMKNQGEPPQRISEGESFRRSWRILRADPALKWLAVTNMCFGLVLPFNYYWTPLFEPRVGTAGLSWIWVVSYGALVLSGWVVRGRRASLKGREPHGIVLALLLSGLGLALAGLTSGVLVPLAFTAIHEFGRGAFRPFTSALMQRRIESEYRATYGSCQSLISRGGNAIVVFVLWLALGPAKPTASTIGATWAICGFLLAAAAIILWLRRTTRGSR